MGEDVRTAGVPRLALSSNEVAAALGIGRRTLQNWLAAGRFPPADLRIARTHRWRPATIEAWLSSGAARDHLPEDNN